MTDQNNTPENETNNTEQEKNTPETAEVKLSKAEFDKIMQEAKEAKLKKAELENRLKTREIEEAKKNQEWQKVAEMKENEAKESKETLDKFKNAFITDKKMAAVREQAIQNGVAKEALGDFMRLVDLNEVQLQTDNEGNYLVTGADRLVSNMKTTKPYFFTKKTPSVNSNSPDVTRKGDSITWPELKEIEKKAKETGDYAAYKEALFKYGVK